MKAKFVFSVLASTFLVGAVSANQTLATATASADAIVTSEPTLAMSATGGLYQKKEIVTAAKIATLTVSATGLPAASAGGFTRIEIESPDRQAGWGPIAYNSARSKGIWTELSYSNRVAQGGKWSPISGSDWSRIKADVTAGGDFTDTLSYHVYPTGFGSPRVAGVYYLRFTGSVTHM